MMGVNVTFLSKHVDIFNINFHQFKIMYIIEVINSCEDIIDYFKYNNFNKYGEFGKNKMQNLYSEFLSHYNLYFAKYKILDNQYQEWRYKFNRSYNFKTNMDLDSACEDIVALKRGLKYLYECVFIEFCYKYEQNLKQIQEDKIDNLKFKLYCTLIPSVIIIPIVYLLFA